MHVREECRFLGCGAVQPPAHAGSSHADFSTLKMEAIRPSETSAHTRSTWRHIPEDGILHSHRRKNLKSYMYLRISMFVFKSAKGLPTEVHGFTFFQNGTRVIQRQRGEWLKAWFYLSAIQLTQLKQLLYYRHSVNCTTTQCI
jgi:hypothetical protein